MYQKDKLLNILQGDKNIKSQKTVFSLVHVQTAASYSGCSRCFGFIFVHLRHLMVANCSCHYLVNSARCTACSPISSIKFSQYYANLHLVIQSCLMLQCQWCKQQSQLLIGLIGYLQLGVVSSYFTNKLSVHQNSVNQKQ